MLELLLCSLLTVLPDYLFRRYAQGKRLGDNLLLGLVRAEVGDHGLPHSYSVADYDDFLQPSIDHERHTFLQNRSDHF